MPAMLKSSRSSLLAASALMAMALAPGMQPASAHDGPAARTAAATPAAPKHSTKAPTSPEQRAAWMRVRSNGAASRRFPGRGWSVAHDRRMARKRRNVIKARRAGRR